MKRFITLLLVLIIMSNFTIIAYAATLEPAEPNVGGSGIAYYEEEIKRELKGRDIFIAFHPDYPNYSKVSVYSFPAGEQNLSVSIGGSIYFLSFSLAVTSAPSYYSIFADGTLYSRPALYGNRYEVTYRYGQYNYNTKTWVSIKGTTTKLDYVVDSIKVYYA